MVGNSLWDAEEHGSHAERVGAGESCAEATTRHVEGAPSTPRLTVMDRIFWVVLSRLWTGWRYSLQVVRPETVVGWHRQGFRRYWAWKSRRRSGLPMIGTELRELIRRISRANPLSLLKSRPARLICILRTDQLSRRSWSDGSNPLRDSKKLSSNAP